MLRLRELGFLWPGAITYQLSQEKKPGFLPDRLIKLNSADPLEKGGFSPAWGQQWRHFQSDFNF